MTIVMTAGRAIFTPRATRYRGEIPDDPNNPGKRRGFLKFLEAHSIAARKDGSMPAEPDIRERWHVAKITLHAHGDPIVFALVQLRFVENVATPMAVKRYYEGIGGDTVCRCEYCACRNTHCRNVEQPPNMKLCCAGLMRKYREGQHKLRSAKQRCKAGRGDARDTTLDYQAVAVWEIVQIQSIIGGLCLRCP